MPVLLQRPVPLSQWLLVALSVPILLSLPVPMRKSNCMVTLIRITNRFVTPGKFYSRSKVDIIVFSFPKLIVNSVATAPTAVVIAASPAVMVVVLLLWLLSC